MRMESHAIDINKRWNLDISNEKDQQTLVAIASALSSPIRVKMLDLLRSRILSVSDLAKACFISISTAMFHVSVLEKAGLIVTEYKKGAKRDVLICNNTIRELNVDLYFRQYETPEKHIFTQAMPVGFFSEANLGSRYAFVSKERLIAQRDNENWYSMERSDAQLLWANYGYVLYRFSNEFTANFTAEELSFSLEICSEAPTYRNDWKSDIDFYINGIKAASYRCPGDFGGRRGKYNPPWWPDNCTQYGQLLTITIDKKQTYINGIEQANGITLNALHIEKGNDISFKIESSQKAEYCGGFNLFGKGFGDYPQDIVLQAVCTPK